eukprot:1706167-Rhodomonas_salina.4
MAGTGHEASHVGDGREETRWASDAEVGSYGAATPFLVLSYCMPLPGGRGVARSGPGVCRTAIVHGQG